MHPTLYASLKQPFRMLPRETLASPAALKSPDGKTFILVREMIAQERV